MFYLLPGLYSTFQLVDGLFFSGSVDANIVLAVLTTPISLNKSEVLLA